MLKECGETRRIRNAIIRRGETIESLPQSEENKAYVRGLEFALEMLDREIES